MEPGMAHGPEKKTRAVPRACSPPSSVPHRRVLLHRRLLTHRQQRCTLQSLLLSCAADYSNKVVRGLISDIESPSTPVESQRQAAMVLRLLAKHKLENRLKIACVGAVRPLVALISHPDPQLHEHGVTAILNLSLCNENKDPIAAARAIRPLIRTLKTGTPATRENAAYALLRLSQFSNRRTQGTRAVPPEPSAP